MGIPREFSHGDRKPSAKTVGELMDQLAKLPRSLKICRGLGRGPRKCVVYNVEKGNPEFDLVEAFP